VCGQLPEERVAAAEQDGHLVEDHLVDEARRQRGGQRTAALTETYQSNSMGASPRPRPNPS
jgi:hypothetical protein